MSFRNLSLLSSYTFYKAGNQFPAAVSYNSPYSLLLYSCILLSFLDYFKGNSKFSASLSKYPKIKGSNALNKNGGLKIQRIIEKCNTQKGILSVHIKKEGKPASHQLDD